LTKMLLFRNITKAAKDAKKVSFSATQENLAK